jgi:hypothetical protein
VITIQMNNQEFEPGEQIQGKIRWSQLSKGVDLDIRLIWFTLGKGSRDYAIVANQPIKQPAEIGESEFSFVAPDWPHSFSGELISLLWSIEVVELPSEDATEVEIVIAPGKKEVQLPRESQMSIPSPPTDPQ